MATITTEVAQPPTPRVTTPAKRPSRIGRRARRAILPIWGWLVILWLSSPIIVMIVFGFNSGNTIRSVNSNFQGVTLEWYRQLFVYSDLTTAIKNSITIALLTTVIAVVLGTLMGVAMGRWKFRGQGSVNLLLFANIAAPEVVLGAALLSLFLTLGIPRGYLTILIAHVMFSVAYVVVTVRARMAGMDPALEEAARDLGAGPVMTFFRITLPGIMPGVMAGALLAFALSIDDYIITSFNNGATQTFPLWVYGAFQRTGGSVPPQVNVMGTIIFAFGVLVAVAGVVNSRKKA
ncbi:MAG: ABC transporter permease [Mycobacterium sp.]|nr:ABC transporter permease [Mycobacterium sp.]